MTIVDVKIPSKYEAKEGIIHYVDPKILHPHPSALLIPMSDSDVQALHDDIVKHGITHALDITSDGDILDGVHRWEIAQKLELSQILVRIYHYEHSAEEHLHAMRSNLKRRHLNEGQRGGLALLMLPYEEELARLRKSESAQEATSTQPRNENGKFKQNNEPSGLLAIASNPDGDVPLDIQKPPKRSIKPKGSSQKKQGTSAHKAGQNSGVSADTVYKAKKLQEDAPPLFDAMMQGEISVSKAYKQVKDEEKVQEVKKLQSEDRPLTDLEIMTKLSIPVLPYDVWNFSSCDTRFGHDDYPGRIPGQLVAHCLYFWTEQGDTILDPMVGSGTTIDVCKVLKRKVLAYDAHPCREDITQHNLDVQGWPERTAEAKLIFWDPPYFKKVDGGYGEQSISRYGRKEYLDFFDRMAQTIPGGFKGRLAFLMSDYNNEENPSESIWFTDYIDHFVRRGWSIERFIQIPLTTQSVHADTVKKFRENKRLARLGRVLGVMCR